jgi:hypothetical protein
MESKPVKTKWGSSYELQNRLDEQSAALKQWKSEIALESSLERVRAIAMSMMRSDDLLHVCESVFTHMQILGFRDLRNAQIYISDDDKGKFQNYNYSDYSGTEIVEVLYDSHPNVKGIYHAIRQWSDAFADYEISGNEQMEASLERVRSRTLAMQKSDELAETAGVLFWQLMTLGIAPNRLSIAFIKDESGYAEFWITDEDGSKLNSGFAANLHENRSFQKMFDGWQAGSKSITIDMQGKELQEYVQHRSSLNVPFKGGLSQKRRVKIIAYLSKSCHPWRRQRSRHSCYYQGQGAATVLYHQEGDTGNRVGAFDYHDIVKAHGGETRIETIDREP